MSKSEKLYFFTLKLLKIKKIISLKAHDIHTTNIPHERAALATSKMCVIFIFRDTRFPSSKGLYPDFNLGNCIIDLLDEVSADSPWSSASQLPEHPRRRT